MTESDVIESVLRSEARTRIVDVVAELGLPECWIAGGFVRNAVWDDLFRNGNETPINDVDVVYFKPLTEYGLSEEKILGLIARNSPNPVWDEEDRMREVLANKMPGYEFEVKNQARMHQSPVRVIKHDPYRSISDAVAGWVETATATGVRRTNQGYEVLAPYGLEDLAEGIVRPTHELYTQRARERAMQKNWSVLWPQVRFEPYDSNRTRRR